MFSSFLQFVLLQLKNVPRFNSRCCRRDVEEETSVGACPMITYKQVMKTRKRSSRIRTSRSSPYRDSLSRGVSLTKTPWQRPPGQRPPHPPVQRPLPLDRDPRLEGNGTRDKDPRKEHGSRQPDKKWHHTDPPPIWTEWLTHASENITLPQTSFAGGKYGCQKWPYRFFILLDPSTWVRCYHESLSAYVWSRTGLRGFPLFDMCRFSNQTGDEIFDEKLWSQVID